MRSEDLSQRISQQFWRGMGLVVLTLFWPSLAAAQNGGAAPTGLSLRNYWMDAAIFVGLVGGALFAVCRSSQRV